VKASSIALLFLASTSTACSTKAAPTSSAELMGNTRSGGPSSASLPAGIIATVGSLSIPEEAVVSVAKTQQIPPRRAAESEVRDALFAAAALQRGYEDFPQVSAALRGRLARARLETLQQKAAAAPITDAEVQEATAPHFLQLDRPEAFRVIHAVVMVTEKADPGERAKAKALAERIAERVVSAKDADEFKARVESMDHEGFEVRIESLKPVAADGRIVDVAHPSSEDHGVLVAFSRAAARLAEPGQKSGVVATDYGFHVMMLLERTPPYVVALEERRRLLHDEILTERAKRMTKELVEQLRNVSHPVVERAADALVATVAVDDHETP